MKNIIPVKVNKSILKKTFLNKDSTIKDAIKSLQKSSIQISLVINHKSILVGTITDGDIRRALINGYNLNNKVSKILNKKPFYIKTNTNISNVAEMMIENDIKQVPVIDSKGIVSDLFTLKSLSAKKNDRTIIIMAGGFGKRMLPITNKIPKALVLVNDKPMIDHIIDLAKSYFYKNFIISTHYLKNHIFEHFKKSKFKDLNIQFLNEKKALGTIGSLSLINNKISSPIIIFNCDVITNINLDYLIEYHEKNKSDFTIVSKEFRTINPYGVIISRGKKVLNIIEKPEYKSVVMAGIYVISPSLLKLIKKNTYLQMNTFIENIINKKKKVLVFPLHEKLKEYGFYNEIKKYNE